MLQFENVFSMAIKEAVKILKNPQTSQQLRYINNNYKSISTALLKLEAQGMLLMESVK